MKTKYILHGGFTSEDTPTNNNFFKEFFIDAPEQPKALIVLFASENDGDMSYYHDLCNRI